MTTNMGADKISKNTKIGFKQLVGDEQKDEAKTDAMKEVKDGLKPELINRIDEVVVFNTLNKSDANQIVRLLFDKYVLRVKEEHDITLTLHKTAVDYFTKEGFSEEYGARELSRTIRRNFETKFSQLLLNKTVKSGTSMTCSVKDKAIKFRKTIIRKKS